MQMIGVMLYDFATTVRVVYLVVRKVSGNFTVTGAENYTDAMLLNTAIGLLSTVAVCLASTWTSEQVGVPNGVAEARR